jgi:hypothetical protein
MFQEFLASTNLLIWPLVALGIFFVAFVLAVLYAAVGLRGGRADHLAALPLQADDEGRDLT